MPDTSEFFWAPLLIGKHTHSCMQRTLDAEHILFSWLQDFRLSEQVAKAGCAVVLVANKWDRVPPKVAEDMDAYRADVKAQLRAVGWASVVCTTAR